MIHGIGTDIVDIARIRRFLERHGERAAQRILAQRELEGFSAAREPAAFLAKRFAAKEAFSKAFGSGLQSPVTLHSVAVDHDDQGKPLLVYGSSLAALMRSRRLAAHLSLSDDVAFAIAFVVIECDFRNGP